MQKHYFELDKVDSITLTMEGQTGYKWFEAIPPQPKTFLGIKYGMTEGIRAGWSDYDLKYHQCDKDRVQSSYFTEYPYPWYRVDESTKKVFNKAHVEVRFGYKQSIGTRFESNEEAQAWVDEIIASSDKKFHVIINK